MPPARAPRHTATMDKMTPDQLIYHCKLSQQMSRHDESTRILQEMLKRGSLFGATERCLLNVAYSEALKQRRHAWKGLAELENQEEQENDLYRGTRRAQADIASAYRRHVEGEISSLCRELLHMIERLLEGTHGGGGGGSGGGGMRGGGSGSGGGSGGGGGGRAGGKTEEVDEGKRGGGGGEASSSSSSSSSSGRDGEKGAISRGMDTVGRSMCFQLRGDAHRYLAEMEVGDERRQASAKAQRAYEAAVAVVEGPEGLHAADPARLGVALNFSVFLADTSKDFERACRFAKENFDAASAVHQSHHAGGPGGGLMNPREEQTSIGVMKLLRENLERWTSDPDAGE